MKAQEEEIWKRKLLAYLHDPPCKATAIATHEDVAASFIKAEFEGENEAKCLVREADRLEASIGRFPFPKLLASAHFDGKEGNTFRHPFMDREDNWYELDLKPYAHYEELLHDAVNGIQSCDYRKRHFLYWRRWREESARSSSEMSFFPADTRIPDHSIWTHLDMTSALEGCRNPETDRIEPAFLIFQAGPVQSFVAAARSTMDLWSGSYMLSWLMGNAIKAVTDECGPDAIVFPSLRGNGIFDILNKEDIYDGVVFTGKDGKADTLWQRLYAEETREKRVKNLELLTNPTLPNKFFAIIPANRAKELAMKAENAFRKELENISEACLSRLRVLAEKAGVSFEEGWATRWRGQVSLHSDITWQCLVCDTDIESILSKSAKLPGQADASSPLSNVRRLVDFVQKAMPLNERDERYYRDDAKTRLSNWGIAWTLNYARAEYLLDARRKTRCFDAFSTDENQAGSPKDELTGAEECIGSEELWKVLKAPDAKDNERFFFSGNEGRYGAMSIMKRLWCTGDESYLLKRIGASKEEFQKVMHFDSVQDVAKKNKKANSPYVAVLALDGDEMGKWLSGEKAPRYKNVLAGKARDYFREHGLEDVKRSLTPVWHLQFSEALSNFSNHIAGKVVAHYDGQLIYAGGDDVLAMLPADRALECACALRALFRGDGEFLERCVPEYNTLHFAVKHQGFVATEQGELLVPGCDADVSCGIAVAHYKYPLQSIVAEARSAEARAKGHYGRSAVSVSLLKHSGEIIQWGSKWRSGGMELYNNYLGLRNENTDENAAQRFPYALSALLQNYGIDEGHFEDGFDPELIMLKELQHVMRQQMSALSKDERDKFFERAREYVHFLKAEGKMEEFEKLFLMAAFIDRNREDL